MVVLIADDHEIVRKGLKQLLESHRSITKVLEAGDGKKTFELIKSEKIDLVVLDISMPGFSGLEVLNNAKEMNGDTKFLILSMYPEKEYALRSLKAGADGYITKDSAGDELLQAIDSVLSGRKYVSKNLQEILYKLQTKTSDIPKHELLSDQEFKVFLLLAKGKRIFEIADQLFLSSKTVSTYKSRLMKKMNLESVSDITKYAIKHNLID